MNLHTLHRPLHSPPPAATETPREPTWVPVAGFLVIVGLSIVQQWSATDLIWSLWLSSLLIGFALILTRILGEAVRLGGIMGVGMALGLTAFMAFHFGLFHFVHGVFLSVFFPPFPSPVEDEFLASRPFLTETAPLKALGQLLAAYWSFVVVSLLQQPGEFVRAWRTGMSELMRPYLNVVKMHLLIFVFAGLMFVSLPFGGLSRFALYPILLFYFLPESLYPKGVREWYASTFSQSPTADAPSNITDAR